MRSLMGETLLGEAWVGKGVLCAEDEAASTWGHVPEP